MRFARGDWIAAAAQAAHAVTALHLERTPAGVRLRRASLEGRVSDAVATLEDYGGLAGGLLRLALATGEAQWAVLARELVDACIDGQEVAAPGGGDPVLAARGIAVDADRTEGATPSGAALLADAAARLAVLTAARDYRAIAERTLAPSLAPAIERPIAYGATLAVAARLAAPAAELVVVRADGTPASSAEALVAEARAWARPTRTLAIVTEAQAAAFAAAGFELFADRLARGGAAAYLCEGFTCRLPTGDAAVLADQLRG
jgi:uncharacterized protein YyaL (SSP411 family)